MASERWARDGILRCHLKAAVWSLDISAAGRLLRGARAESAQHIREAPWENDPYAPKKSATQN